MMPPRVVFILSVALVIAAAMMSVQHYRAKAQRLESENAVLSDRVSQANNALLATERRQKALQALDTRHTQELSDAQTENSRLRDAVAAGTQRLYIKAACPVPKAGSGAAARVGNGASAEVDRATGQDIFTLREELIRDRQKLAFLQDYVRHHIERKK